MIEVCSISSQLFCVNPDIINAQRSFMSVTDSAFENRPHCILSQKFQISIKIGSNSAFRGNYFHSNIHKFFNLNVENDTSFVPLCKFLVPEAILGGELFSVDGNLYSCLAYIARQSCISTEGKENSLSLFELKVQIKSDSTTSFLDVLRQIILRPLIHHHRNLVYHGTVHKERHVQFAKLQLFVQF